MTRLFNMTLAATYSGDENTVDQLQVEHQVEDNRPPLDLGLRTPGFDVFVYAILTCQHTYFRINAAEQGILLSSSTGNITVSADSDWLIESINVDFRGVVHGESPADNTTRYILDRMQQCPVSKNLAATIDTTTTLDLRPA